MKLTLEDIEYAKDGILYHLNEVDRHLRLHFERSPVLDGKPLHRIKARYELNAIGYILDDLKRHLHNDDLLD